MNKYVPKSQGIDPLGRGRPVKPETWITGPDPETREKYYAYLKHRSQARYRKEEYALTWEDWQELWENLWSQRGRKSEQYSLYRKDTRLPWSTRNATVIQNQHKGLYYQPDRKHGGRPRKGTQQ